jgi:hypothetical protein
MLGQLALLRPAMPSFKRQLHLNKESPGTQIRRSIGRWAAIEIRQVSPFRPSNFPRAASVKHLNTCDFSHIHNNVIV